MIKWLVIIGVRSTSSLWLSVIVDEMWQFWWKFQNFNNIDLQQQVLPRCNIWLISSITHIVRVFRIVVFKTSNFDNPQNLTTGVQFCTQPFYQMWYSNYEKFRSNY